MSKSPKTCPDCGPKNPKFSPSEYLRVHAQNMQGDVVFKDLPFFQWIKEQKKTPERFVEALTNYYEGHEIKGAFDEKEIASYKTIYEHFWWEKCHKNKIQIDD